MLPLRLLIFAFAVSFAAESLRAATPASSVPPVPKWSGSVSAYGSGGYKDNVLLSAVAPERSGFARYGVEAFLWHLPRGYTDYSAIVTAEQTRYFSSATVDREAYADASFQWRYQVEDRFRFAFDLLGLYVDEIRDVSDTEVERLVAELKLASVAVGPTVRWSPRPWGWLEIQATGQRESSRENSYNGKVGEGTARLGWKPSARFELSIAVSDRRRRYDHRTQYSLGGLPLLDTLLVISEREQEARCDIVWDKAERWATQTRISQKDYNDNGSGFFNYDRRRASHSLTWKTEKWRVKGEGEASRREFPNQTVGRGTNPPIRFTEEFTAKLHVERVLSPRWSIYADYRWERNRSNETIAAYRVNEGLLGARWNWEK